ncbi:Long-chain-fatty-acid--CoA ligase [Pannonibacter phragmitetus]|uniref:Long-chain-fatty-acid--CoA ligase n=2 Tax=Pannonibacter phragmitetus TaxID=121719 RepID=A0A378ZVW1_9HYPH|nr:Long-chain-fatty-acid--CoA ligase [Pannonibacter phragmitetus]
MSQAALMAQSISALARNTVAEIFLNSLETAPDRRFAKSFTADLTYREAALAAGAIAARLAGKVDSKPVGFVLPNSVSLLITYLGVLFAGGQPALLNPALPTQTRTKLLDRLAPAAIITSDPELTGPDVIFITDAGLPDLVAEGVIPQNRAQPDDVAVFLYSGGTTGVPKRVAHTHRALCAAVERMEWGWPTVDGDVWLPIAPFTHVYGFLMGVANPMLNAGSIIIPDRFHPATIVEMLAEHDVTVFGGGPPAIYQGLLSVPDLGRGSLPSLRVCPGGGAPFPVELHRRWQEVTGLTIHEGYGMTEIAPIAINNAQTGIKLGAAGKPVPGTQIQIVDTMTGTRLMPAGEPGEIRVRGPHQMTGYADSREETAQMLRDGWVYTGDIGVLDEDGFLTITDRKKNVIFHKGFNVFPREIEEVLMTHEAVSSVSVVGTPDERSGEIAVAFVVARAPVEAKTLMQHCAAALVPYKIPARIEFLDQMPLTPAGKADRMAMQSMAAAPKTPDGPAS